MRSIKGCISVSQSILMAFSWAYGNAFKAANAFFNVHNAFFAFHAQCMLRAYLDAFGATHAFFRSQRRGWRVASFLSFAHSRAAHGKIFDRTAKASHLVAFKVRQYNQGVEARRISVAMCTSLKCLPLMRTGTSLSPYRPSARINGGKHHRGVAVGVGCQAVVHGIVTAAGIQGARCRSGKGLPPASMTLFTT